LYGRTLSRRTLLVGAGATAALTALSSISSSRSTAAAPAEPVDVLIVGSGYAGAIAAFRLAEAGINSVVVERGRRWPIRPTGDTFATPENPDGRAAWLSTTSPFTPEPLDIYPGVLEAYQADGVMALAGAGVGGGSLVNSAVMMQPSRELFNLTLGRLLDYDEMDDVWFPRARNLIGATPMPDDVYNSSYYRAARGFYDAAQRAGLDPIRVDMALDWDVVRGEMTGRYVQSAVLGHSTWGMNSGAKRSVDRTILAAAEATRRVAVVTLTRVVSIVQQRDRYLVSCERINESGTVVARPTFSARHVILAAGSLGTTKLLVRARARRELPLLSPRVGTAWCTNGDTVAMWSGMPDNNPGQGGPSGIIARDWVNNPIGPVTGLNFPWPGMPAGTGALAGLFLGLAPAVGRFSYNHATDEVRLTWPASAPAVTQVVDAVTDTVGRFAAVDGATPQFITPERTSHPLGGVPLGIATDLLGRLRGYPNLYVIDSALIPGSTGGAPPALTVAALADRCVTGLLEADAFSPSRRPASLATV